MISSTATRVRSRATRLVASVAAAVVLVAGGVIAGPAQTADAYTGADFDRGYIISDQQFYARDAMSQAEIQSFLDAKIGTCLNSNCLNVVRTTTFTRPADRTICTQYNGAANETTAAIIYKVQQACGISAKVLLVTLQKEQSLVTHQSPSTGRLAAAMGYACPDTAPCDAQFYGLYNQIYKAAWQFKRYSTPDPWGNIQPGGNLISLSTNACGQMWVNVRNNATAALYNYTPYTPNQAALDNLGREGDWCSSYGNRNFWDYYYSWFGNPTGIVPTGITTSRIQGPDRWSTAVEISKALGVANPDTVYVASGLDFPDALSAAPAASFLGGPLLLVAPDGIHGTTQAELTRLRPKHIVIVGSTTAVSAQVETQLAQYASVDVRRDGGADRFETSRMIAQKAFPSSTTAYIATGFGFADALTASAAAGVKDAPVILVNGNAPTVDQPTMDTLTALGVTNVIIAGSNVVVTDGIAASIDAMPNMTVTRLGGKDRFATASAIVKNAFPTSPTVYLAIATNFPDALAGAVLAGSKGSALLLSGSTCVFRQTAQDLIDLKTTKAVLLGSTDTLSGSVGTFANCD